MAPVAHALHGRLGIHPFAPARCMRAQNRVTKHAMQALPPAATTQHNHQDVSCPAPQASRRSLLGAALLLSLPALQSQPAAAKPLTVIDVDKAGPGERDVYVTNTGIKYAEVSKGSGTISKSGDLVLVDVVGRLEGGQVFLDTRKLNTPLAFQIGTSNKYVPEGISQLVEGMSSGSVRLAVLPPAMGYGDKSVALPGATVPPNSKLFYEVELLRCEKFTLGLACCTEQVFTGNKGADNDGSCIKKPQPTATVGTPS